ncbi:hypothetical protein [Amnibacterium endophyticum]|uniref:DUF5666 domain-containing protein n=1 Tax=Amnibacterium endophyticum TaxID=2109337 RepID=A0ABW4LH46_9MICO
MQSFRKPTKRTALITGVAGAAVLGAIAVGGPAYADGMPSAAPSGSVAAPSAAAPSGAPTAPAAPSGAPAAPAAPGQHGPQGGPAGAPSPKPHIGGEVLSVSGSTVTVKDHDGFTRTIALSSGATVTKDGQKADTSAIVQGAHIEATGSVDSNGTTLDATEVRVGQPAGPGKGGPAASGPAADAKGGPAAGPAAGGRLPPPPQGGKAPQAPGQQGGAQQATPTPSASGYTQGS